MHTDRLESVARLIGDERHVIGVGLYDQSAVYEWVSPGQPAFRKMTILPGDRRVGGWRVFGALARSLVAVKADCYFLCHYERVYVLFVAFLLRILGRRVFTMGCSKFDDYPRSLWREVGKSMYMLPYQGAISSGYRNRDYLRFLRVPAERILPGYNSVSLDRIRAQAPGPIAPDGVAFADRGFVAVARLIPKKNLGLLIDAFACYRGGGGTRTLTLCGSGPLEAELRAQCAAREVADCVVFTGFVQTEEISAILARSLALLLPSISEQFGNAVIEAQAFGLPVVLSGNCGAADDLVRSGVNGFVLHPDNEAGLTWCMELLSTDEALWRRMSVAASAFAPRGDSARFAESVMALVGGAS